MKRIGREDAQAVLVARHAKGLNVDQRLFVEIAKPGELYLLNMETEAAFLALVWQSCHSTRPLTPVGMPRNLKDCASRLDQYHWSFSTLCELGHPWFQRCIHLDEEFDFDAFGWLALVPANQHEILETPGGSLYVFDGVHRSLVLAKKLLRREVTFKPLEALVMTPRR